MTAARNKYLWSSNASNTQNNWVSDRNKPTRVKCSRKTYWKKDIYLKTNFCEFLPIVMGFRDQPNTDKPQLWQFRYCTILIANTESALGPSIRAITRLTCMWVLKVKVISWPWPKVVYIQKFKLDFIRNWTKFSGTRKWKSDYMMLVTWPRWPPCPYMVKTLQKSSPESAGRFPRNLVCSIRDSSPS